MDTVNTENNGRDKNGRFTNGNSGRPPLSKNQIQQEIRDQLGIFLEGKLKDIDNLYKKLPDRDKAKLIMEVVSYFTPKLRQVDANITQDEPAKRTFPFGGFVNGEGKWVPVGEDAYYLSREANTREQVAAMFPPDLSFNEESNQINQHDR